MIVQIQTQHRINETITVHHVNSLHYERHESVLGGWFLLGFGIKQMFIANDSRSGDDVIFPMAAGSPTDFLHAEDGSPVRRKIKSAIESTLPVNESVSTSRISRIFKMTPALVMSRSLSLQPLILPKSPFVFSNRVGEQGRRQIPGGARPHHDFPQVQHPEVLPGRRHHPLRSPRRHGRQRLLRPLCENVSTRGDAQIQQVEGNRSGMFPTGARLRSHRRQIEK